MRQSQMLAGLRRELSAARWMARKTTNELGGYSATRLLHQLIGMGGKLQ